jgi:methyltransferase (TIGR00027 family)
MALNLPIKAISDTAFLTALYRARESDRLDAHFHDPYAQTLAGTRGEEVLHQIPNGEAYAAGCVVRTCVMDEIVMQAVEQEKVDTVLNLGSGFDTRPYRLSLPSSLHWIETDLPDVLAYKADKLASAHPVCKLESIPLDVTDTTARQKLFEMTAQSNQVLVITEGLLIYLPVEQVAALAQDLYTTSQFCWWLSDLASPTGLQLIQQSLGEVSTNGGTRMQFAPTEGTGFFELYGWKAIKFLSFIEEAQRLQRGALPEEFIAQLSQEHWKILRQMSGVILLTKETL